MIPFVTHSPLGTPSLISPKIPLQYHRLPKKQNVQGTQFNPGSLVPALGSTQAVSHILSHNTCMIPEILKTAT